MTYGVTSTGFIRKPLSVILAEAEQKNIDVFGPQVVQTPQSPMGQINGVRSEIISEVWEIFEDIYQSIDPDQAEGVRLDALARLRLLERATDQSDQDFRQQITNDGILNLSEIDFHNAIKNTDGVTWFSVYYNDTEAVLNTMPTNSATVAALGGDDAEIAEIARRFIIPGITHFGNVRVDTEINGICRSQTILRPELVGVKIRVNVTKTQDYNECPPPSDQTLVNVLSASLTGFERIKNGKPLDFSAILNRLKTYDQVTLDSVEYRFLDTDPWTIAPLSVNFDQIVNVTSITVGTITGNL